MSLAQVHRAKTKVSAFRRWDFGNDSSVTPSSCSAELHFSQNGHKSHGADTPVSRTPPFQVPQCHLRRGACGKAYSHQNWNQTGKNAFEKWKNDCFSYTHMAAILPIIANTQQLKTPSEKDIVKTGGKSLFSLQLLHHGRPNDNSLRTPDKTVLCGLVSPLYSTEGLCLSAGT